MHKQVNNKISAWVTSDSRSNISGTMLVFNDMIEKKRIENKLKESDEQYKSLLENLPEAVYTCDASGYIKLYNKAAASLWGREPVPGKDLWCGSWKIFNTDGANLPLDRCPMAIALKQARSVQGSEIIIQRPDGSFRHVLSYPFPLFNTSGQITGAVNMLIDLTDKKEKEILLKQSEEKYRTLIEQAAYGIFIFDQQGNFISANTSGCLMLGYDRENLMRLNLKDITPAEFSGKMPINLSRLNNGNPLLVERQFMHKDGTVFYTEVRAQIVAEGNIQAIVKDITDHKNAQERMLKAIERYEILAKATSDTIWDWDITNNMMLFNEGVTNILGYEKSEVKNLVDWWKRNIHPDDLRIVSESLDEVFEKEMQTIQLQYRFRCADGSYKYIYDRAFVIYDENQKPIRMIGAMQDVTYKKEEKKRIAKAIIDAQEKERCYIGQELHDNVNQILVGSLLTLGMVKEKQKDIGKAFEFIEITKGHIGNAIGEVRKLSHQLAPATSDYNSLKDIFENLLLNINLNNRYNITLHLGEINKKYISDDIHINLYRILQEQIKNIVKYSEASSIEIAVTLSGNAVRMRIFDNGKGFNTKTVKKGIGLSNIKKRVESFSGKFILNSAAGKGCEIIVEIPLDNAE